MEENEGKDLAKNMKQEREEQEKVGEENVWSNLFNGRNHS